MARVPQIILDKSFPLFSFDRKFKRISWLSSTICRLCDPEYQSIVFGKEISAQYQKEFHSGQSCSRKGVGSPVSWRALSFHVVFGIGNSLPGRFLRVVCVCLMLFLSSRLIRGHSCFSLRRLGVGWGG